MVIMFDKLKVLKGKSTTSQRANRANVTDNISLNKQVVDSTGGRAAH